MFEDGVYVSYFLDDVQKKKEPRSVVVISNGKVEVIINTSADDETKTYLNDIVDRLDKTTSKSAYEDVAYVGLGKFWESNGYSPNPSDFFESDSDEAKTVLTIARGWATSK